MAKKNKKVTVGGDLNFKGNEEEPEIVSALQATPDGEPIVKHFSSQTSSGDIVRETFRNLEEAGYRLKPKTLDIFVKTIEDMIAWMKTYDKLKRKVSSMDLLFPGHDMRMLTQYPLVAEDITRLV
jgi:hypothetical protein